MAFPPFFQGYVDHLRALGWTVELICDRIALYSPAEPRGTARSRPCIVLYHDPVVTKQGPPVALVPAVRPYRLYNRRFYRRRTFPTLESAAALFLKEAVHTAPHVRDNPAVPPAAGTPTQGHR